MAKNIHKEMQSLINSTAWKYIFDGLERRKKDILQQMLDASIFAGMSDTLDENAKKQLYMQHLLKIQYMFIEHLLQIPQTIINSTPKEDIKAEQIDEYLSLFDRQYPSL